MPTTPTVFHLARCGPSDVTRELEIVGKVIDEWNQAHGLDANFLVRHAHWSTDASPDLSGRPQAVINRQIIDKADIVVAILWMRFGTPTELAGSGTEEEIMRSIHLNKRVLLYFSDLENTKSFDEDQFGKVQSFRKRISPAGLHSSFKNRAEFEKLFRVQFGQMIQELIAAQKPTKSRVRPKKTVSQQGVNNANILGSHNTVNQTVQQRPPKVKIIVPPPHGAVSPAEKRMIKDWIDELVDATANTPRDKAYRSWWTRVQNLCSVTRYEDIMSDQMCDVERWFRQQRSILVSKLRTKAPDQWRSKRISAIKAAMKQMGRANEDYYPEIGLRLKMKKPLVSLTKLTKTDLERVYRMVLADARP